jgi:DeoR/GlpR family transcriptional regulator of sugar metabolism
MKTYSKIIGLDKRKHEFNDRIRRLSELYEKQKLDESIDLEKLSQVNGKSVRTLRRDLTVLEDVEGLGKSALGVNRSVRIMALYVLWKTNHVIPMAASCRRFGISERTFRRDIKVLEDSLGLRLDYDNYRDGYA